MFSNSPPQQLPSSLPVLHHGWPLAKPQENALLRSMAASSSRSVQWTAFSALDSPNAALRVPGRSAFANRGSAGPHSWRRPSAADTTAPGMLLTSKATEVMGQQNLDDWKLYLVDWGYNTEAERRAAGETGRVAVIDKKALEQLAGTS